MTTRTFTVVGVTIPKHAKKEKLCLGGSFKSKTPVSAAKKALGRICRICKITGVCTLIVQLKETTPNSKNKEYVYKVRRIKKETDVVKTGVDGKKPVNITFKYTTKATSLNQFEGQKPLLGGRRRK